MVLVEEKEKKDERVGLRQELWWLRVKRVFINILIFLHVE